MSLLRTQKRREAREKDKKKVRYNMTQQQLEDVFKKYKEEYRQEVLEETLTSLSYMFAFAMYEELGVGAKRAKKVLSRFCKDALAFDSGHLNMDDIIKFLESKNIHIK